MLWRDSLGSTTNLAADGNGQIAAAIAWPAHRTRYCREAPSRAETHATCAK
jgi:hypothetical protein